MRVYHYQVVFVFLLAVMMGRPLLADTADEQNRRRGEGILAALNEDGREVLQAHRRQQREDMQAQMRAQRESRQALRQALREESDPHKKLDLLAEHIEERQQVLLSRQEKNQTAQLKAYREALEVSGVDAEEKQRVLGRLEQRQARQREQGVSQGQKVLKQITALREQDEISEEDIRGVMAEAMPRAQAERRSAREGERGQMRGRTRERRQAEIEDKPADE